MTVEIQAEGDWRGETLKILDTHDSDTSVSKLDLAIKASDHPEHDKLTADVDIKSVSDLSNAIGEFLDYGLGQLGLVLCEVPHSRRNQSIHTHPTSRSIPSILADYFEIDQTKLEQEKRAMLAALGAMNR